MPWLLLRRGRIRRKRPPGHGRPRGAHGPAAEARDHHENQSRQGESLFRHPHPPLVSAVMQSQPKSTRGHHSVRQDVPCILLEPPFPLRCRETIGIGFLR